MLNFLSLNAQETSLYKAGISAMVLAQLKSEIRKCCFYSSPSSQFSALFCMRMHSMKRMSCHLLQRQVFSTSTKNMRSWPEEYTLREALLHVTQLHTSGSHSVKQGIWVWTIPRETYLRDRCELSVLLMPAALCTALTHLDNVYIVQVRNSRLHTIVPRSETLLPPFKYRLWVDSYANIYSLTFNAI